MEPDTDQKKGPPNVGIEPTTTRLRVVRSTDWANSAAYTFEVTSRIININSSSIKTNEIIIL